MHVGSHAALDDVEDRKLSGGQFECTANFFDIPRSMRRAGPFRRRCDEPARRADECASSSASRVMR